MKKSKLINLLTTLSGDELQDFESFLRSPYFNTREELLPLYQYLKDHAPDFPEEELQKEKVFRAVYPGQIFDEKQLAYRMNYLLKLSERFLSIQSFEQSTAQTQLHLLESLVNRKLEKEFQFVHKKLNRQLEDLEIVQSDGFYQRFRIGEIGDQHFVSKDVRRYDPNLEVASDNLDRFYFSKKLRMLTEMINRQHIFNQTYNQTFKDLLLGGLQDTEILQIPLIKAYYHILKMLGEEESAAAQSQYEEVKQLFQSNFSVFSEADKQNILSHLLNFSIQQIREQTDRQPYTQEALELYMFGIETKIYLQKGQLSPWHYKNIIKLAFNLGNFDWAEEFMYQYSPKLQESFRDNALYYNLADLYYQKKDYEKAMHFLNQVEFTDIHYNLNAKLLLLKIYYELDEEEALLSLLASFTIYLKRNKTLSNELRKTYENFCKLLTRIMRRNFKKRPKIKDDILNVSPLTDRKWLLNVLEQMR